jgi:RHS repeat-associated protein
VLRLTSEREETQDGDGRRVQKSNGKLYWYGAGFEVLDESDLAGAITDEYVFFGGKCIAMLPASGTPIYYVEDLLGTSRVTNTGVVCYDADFYPYGGERTITNTCPQNYKFEGKERDSETGNDDFGARYFSNRFGRWLSADWSAVPVPVPYANLTNPQTLNLYGMVAEDPESAADLDGHCSYGGQPDAQSGGEASACAARETNSNSNNSTGQGTTTTTQTPPDQNTGTAQNQQIVTGTEYNGKSAVEVRTSQITTTVDAHGNVTTKDVHTSAFFSNEAGHEGEFLGATQITFTSKTSSTGKETETVGNAALTRDVAQAAVGNKAFLQGMQAAADGNRQAYLNGAIINDAKAHPGKYVAAAAAIGSGGASLGGAATAAAALRVIGYLGALYEAATHWRQTP